MKRSRGLVQCFMFLAIVPVIVLLIADHDSFPEWVQISAVIMLLGCGLSAGVIWHAGKKNRFTLAEARAGAFFPPIGNAFGQDIELLRDEADLDPFHDLIGIGISVGADDDDEAFVPTHARTFSEDRFQMQANVSAKNTLIVVHGLTYIPGIITIAPRRESGRRIRHHGEGKTISFGEDPEFRNSLECRCTIPVPAGRYMNPDVRESFQLLLDVTAPSRAVFQLQRHRLLIMLDRGCSLGFPTNPESLTPPESIFRAVVEDAAFLHDIWTAFRGSALATTSPFPEQETMAWRACTWFPG